MWGQPLPSGNQCQDGMEWPWAAAGEVQAGHQEKLFTELAEHLEWVELPSLEVLKR